MFADECVEHVAGWRIYPPPRDSWCVLARPSVRRGSANTLTGLHLSYELNGAQVLSSRLIYIYWLTDHSVLSVRRDGNIRGGWLMIFAETVFKSRLQEAETCLCRLVSPFPGPTSRTIRASICSSSEYYWVEWVQADFVSTVSTTNPAYTIPGGPVLYPGNAVTTATGSTTTTSRTMACGGGSTDPPSCTRPTSSTSSTRTSSSSTKSSTVTSSTSSGPAIMVPQYGQCGGLYW